MKVFAYSKFLALVFLGSCISICKADQKVSAEIRGHVFTFEKSQNHDRSIDAEHLSTVLVKRIGSETEVFKQVSTLQPGCEAIPKLKKLEDNLVATCGHLGGRHYIYRFYRVGASGIEVATVDAFDFIPEVYSTNGSVSLLVKLRDQLSEITGPVYFPYVYKLHRDQSAFGFHLDYGIGSREQYEKFYSTIKTKDNESYLPAKVATLMAIQDKRFVCHELSEIAKNAKGETHRNLQNSIEKWMAKLPSIGYPTFNLNDCQGVKQMPCPNTQNLDSAQKDMMA
ncbi:hypothetical protein [Pseudoalteromonas xiamenensis]